MKTFRDLLSQAKEIIAKASKEVVELAKDKLATNESLKANLGKYTENINLDEIENNVQNSSALATLSDAVARLADITIEANNRGNILAFARLIYFVELFSEKVEAKEIVTIITMSEVMKLAWSIRKEVGLKNINMSEALKKAWKIAKGEQKNIRN